MKLTRFLFILTCALLAPVSLLADAKAEEAVRTADKEWAAATIKGDLAALEKILHKDLSYTHSDARNESKSQFIGVLKTGDQKYEMIDFDNIEVRVYGNTAVSTSQPKLRTVTKGKPNSVHLRFLHVWVKDQGRWQLVAHQSTRIAQ